MKIALITTVLNEKYSIDSLINSILSQSKKPDEIIVVDAGSNDGTLPILRDLENRDKSIRVFVKKGCERSEGRNFAISKSRADIIVAVDAGAPLDRDFIKHITGPFYKVKSTKAVAGFFKPEVRSFFEKCLAAVTIPTLEEIEPKSKNFLPSSRSVAFKKEYWKKANGYPEWLPICEDLIYDLKLKKLGVRFVFAPSAITKWRPRKNIVSFFKQYFYYARGDGHAKLFRRRHIIRYMSYVSFILLVSLVLRSNPAWFMPLASAGIGYLSKQYHRYFVHFPNESILTNLGAILFIPILVFTGDLGKMLGYPVGIWQRRKGLIKFEEY